MKVGGFLSTSRFIAEEYLKMNHAFLRAIIEKLQRVDEDSAGEFLRIGDNYFITPEGLKVFVSNMAVPGNVFYGVDKSDIERLWNDLQEMGVIEQRLYFLLKKVKDEGLSLRSTEILLRTIRKYEADV
ncbi:MAG: hypothetical protein RBR16_04165 [Syntrophus sp. (in: bacteria)]|jgi:hypothetical protein|nr:hypothetical protein [Syntrophus sp. (in: bacteria)]